MNHLLLGDTTGSMEADFLSLLSTINNNSFKYKSVAAGDVIEISGSHFSVLWSPRLLDNKSTLAVVKNAISDFDEALEKDQITRRVYDSLGERDIVSSYLRKNEHDFMAGAEGRGSDWSLTLPEKRKLPDAVIRANKSLRKAANHISLAFYEDNRILFMGDLESHEIKRVVADLKKNDRTHFLALITPHHGTRWHTSLGDIRCRWAISSIGKGLFKKARSEYKTISDECLLTYVNGDIGIPNPQFWHYPPMWPHYL